MALPDVSRFLALPKDRWRALGVRLSAIGLELGAVEAITRAVSNIPTPMRRPMRELHLRRAKGPAACAMRMMMFEDPITRAEAIDALGEPLLDEMVGCGLIARDAEGRFVSPFLLNVYDDVFVLVDDLSHGGAAVMGSGATTTALARATIPWQKTRSALDLGCGAGTLALLLARQVERVVGTDINPRAITLAKVNAMINGFDNVELREGDLFAPVAGETFDLITAQPPFVPMPEGATPATYLYGGRRGDELALRVLSELPPHLGEHGRAVLFTEWPMIEGSDETLENRVRSVIPSDALNVLLLRTPETNLDEHCTWYAANDHRTLGPEFARLATTRREHFERMKIRALHPTFNVIERAARRPAWTSTVDIRAIGGVAHAAVVTSARIDKLIAARDLLVHGDDDAILDSPLRVPKKTVFVEERTEPDPNAETTMSARFSDTALLPPLGLNQEAFGLISLIHSSDTVRAAAEFLAQALQTGHVPGAIRKVLPHAKEALLHGLLEVKPEPRAPVSATKKGGAS